MQLSERQKDYEAIVQSFDKRLKEAKSYRNKWEIRSYVNQCFYEGNHTVVFNAQTRSFETTPLKDDNSMAIGKVRKIVRGVRNSITRNDPRWHA